MRPTRRVIIDADPGIDDVVAITLAARSPEISLVAVTTTYGNAPLALTTRNARIALMLAGRPDIPVLPGADRPRSRPLATAPETHGKSGIGYASVVPAVPLAPAPHRTVLLDLLDAVPPPVTLVTIGPLTNLAAALEADAPFVLSRVGYHIGMFGSIHERGNANRWADFNAWCDPEAADMVVRSEMPVHMVGLDVTRRMTVTAAEVTALGRSPQELARWLGAALQFYVEFHRSQERLDGCVINDVLTIGDLVAPGMLGFESKDIRIELDETEHRGHTREGGPSSRQVAMSVDTRTMRHLLSRVFGRGWWAQHRQEGLA